MTNKLKIIGLDYEIKSKSPIDLNGDLGSCDSDNCIICISDALTPSNKFNTLLHEILHAINDRMSIGDVDGNVEMTEEDLVDRQSNGWTAVIRDNKKFFLTEIERL